VRWCGETTPPVSLRLMVSPAELVAHLPDDSPFMNTSYTLQSPS